MSFLFRWLARCGQQAASHWRQLTEDPNKPDTAPLPFGSDAADGSAIGARLVLEEALVVAGSATPTLSRGYYREWLATPSSTLHRALGLTGRNPDHWHAHRVPALLARWRQVDGEDPIVEAAAA